MESLPALLLFARVADSLSFAKAARRAGLSPSAVGKAVARLEAELGARLFQRSTRRVSLTAEGSLLLERVRRVIAELDDIDAMMADAVAVPRGRLRLGLPTIGYRFLGPALPAFLEHYPEVVLDIEYDDRRVDVIAEGFDAVIRGGDLADSQLMARKLGTFELGLYASPAYLAHAGPPAKVEDLARHARLCFRIPATGILQEWAVPQWLDAAMQPPRMTCNNVEALRQATIDGLGIAWVPRFLVADAVADGRLVQLLPDMIVERGVFWLLWPSSRHLSPKLRAFADFAARQLVF